jgi:hypothetical protein
MRLSKNKQGRREFMLTVLARLKLWKTKNKNFCLTFVVSQLIDAYARHERNSACLTGAG